MSKIVIQVESLDQGLERFKRTWKTGEYQGEFTTFETVEDLLKTPTLRRWTLIGVLQKQGSMSLRALSRALGRDVKNVHRDVAVLREVGLVAEQGAASQASHPSSRGLYVPYDEIELILRLAA